MTTAVIGAPHIEDVLSIFSVPECRAAVVADLGVAGLYLPAGPGPEPIAGDFYDVLPLVDGQVGLVLGDVTGHGRERRPAAEPRPASIR